MEQMDSQHHPMVAVVLLDFQEQMDSLHLQSKNVQN
jgi:hypothetical protein